MPHLSVNLPPLLHEESLKCFKFLFNSEMHDGLSFKDELFWRFCSVEAGQRAQLYQDACRLSRQENVIITASKSTYSIWISLRSPGTASYLANQGAMPSPNPAFSEVPSPAILEIAAERTASALSGTLARF